MARVLVAMSGGVDSSVAAALLLDAGHEVVGVTMKLWGGEADRGCCSVSDVDDARWVADRLGVEHHVFNFTDEFTRHVVGPYVEAHAAGLTPNPCIECNRHLKFDRLVRRARALGFDRVATGHHARLVHTEDGPRLARGRDRAKDQSYVLAVVLPAVLGSCLFPVGDLTKDEVRAVAAARGLVTAAKPDSQDVCFITRAEGRRAFLAGRLEVHPGTVRDTTGRVVGRVEAVELVTIGQRKGLGLAGGSRPRYAVDVDVAARTVTVGGPEDLCVEVTPVVDWTAHGDLSGREADEVEVQVSAHGTPAPARLVPGEIRWRSPHRRVAPGQTVVAYHGDRVVGAGTAG